MAGGRAEVAGPGRATSAVEWRVVEKRRRSRRLVRSALAEALFLQVSSFLVCRAHAWLLHISQILVLMLVNEI